MNGCRLRKLRTEAGLTQRELAGRLGLSTSAIGMYEQSRREPDGATLLKFCRFFNTTADWLLGYSEMPAAASPPVELSAFLDGMKLALTEQTGLMFNGEPLSPEDIELMTDAMKIGAEIALSKKKK